MARYIYQGTWKDGNGRVVTSGTVSVYLAGTATAASVYVAEVGGSPVNSVTSDSTDGSFSFWVDDSDYAQTQRFKITLSKTNFRSKSYDDLVIYPVSDVASNIQFTTAGYTDKTVEDLVDAGYDLNIKPGTIFGGASNTVGHTVPNVADDTFTLNAAAQTLSNKTLTLPQINDTSADHQYIFTVSELVADRNVNLPLLTTNDEFVFKDFAQTLTNKTLSTGTVISSGPTMSLGSDADGDIYYRGSGVLTRLAKASNGDVLTLAAGIPSWTTPAGLTTSFTSTEQAITTAGTLTLAHSLSTAPNLIQAKIVCKTAELNYSIGDEVIVNNHEGGNSEGNAITFDATNVYVRYGSAGGGVYSLLNKTTGTSASITNANWKLVIKAWA